MSLLRRTLAVAFVLVAGLSISVAASAQDALSVVQTYLAAWNAHDAKAAGAVMADDVTYFDASIGTPQVGRDAAVTNVIEAFLKAAPDAVWKMRGEPIVQDGGVAFEWTFSGTNTGAWADGTAATGKAFSFDGVTVIRVEGGMIEYQGDYYDALGFYKQLGLM